jgi:hypothetical protein
MLKIMPCLDDGKTDLATMLTISIIDFFTLLSYELIETMVTYIHVAQATVPTTA